MNKEWSVPDFLVGWKRNGEAAGSVAVVKFSGSHSAHNTHLKCNPGGFSLGNLPPEGLRRILNAFPRWKERNGVGGTKLQSSYKIRICLWSFILRFLKDRGVYTNSFCKSLKIYTNVLGFQVVASIFASYLIYIIAYLISSNIEKSCLSTYFFSKILFKTCRYIISYRVPQNTDTVIIIFMSSLVR